MIRHVLTPLACVLLSAALVRGQEAKAPLVLKGHLGAIYRLAYSPDGKRLASATSRVSEPGAPSGGEIKVWDTATGKELHSFLEPKGGVDVIRFSPDGKRLASISNTGVARLWDADAGTKHAVLTQKATAKDLAFSPDGKLVAYGVPLGGVALQDAATGKVTGNVKLRRAADDAQRIEFSPDGKSLALLVGSSIFLRDVATGKETLEIEITTRVLQLLFTPDGKKLVGVGGKAFVWDLSNGKQLHELTVKGEGTLLNGILTPDGKRLAAWAPTLRTCHVWDVEGGKEVLASPPFEKDGRYGAALFRPDMKQVAVSLPRQVIKLMDAPPTDRK